MIEYLKENPVLAVILIVCLAVIVLAAVLLAVRKTKAGKASRDSAEKPAPAPPKAYDFAEESAPPASEPISETAPAEGADVPSVRMTDEESADKEPSPARSEEKESAEQEEPSPSEKKETEAVQAPPPPVEEIQPEQSPVPRERADKEAMPAKANPEKAASARKNPKKKKNKNKSKEGRMYLDDLKNAPIEDENDFYDEDDEADRIAKYSGKWVICRVVTAKPDSSELHTGENGEEMYFFELRASNGEKLLSSEEYTSYAGALNGIETHKANIARGNFKIMLSKKGDYIFKLLSGKNMLLCMGEHYATRARCESAIESTKRFAKTAIVDENVQDIVITPPPEDNDETEPEYPDNGYDGKWIVYAHTAEDGEQVFYFELYASNGEKLLSSEEYTTYVGAINGIETHKANIARGNFRISLTKRGDYIYKLLNGNGQLLCLGEHHKTKLRCENAVESVKRFARNAPVLTDPDTIKNA